MLARYQPTEWASHINIDSSRHAAAIEGLLNEPSGTWQIQTGRPNHGEMIERR